MCLSSNQSRNKPYGLELCQQRAPTGFLAQRAMVSHQLGPGNCDAIRYTPEGEPGGEPEGKHAQVASGYSATATATATATESLQRSPVTTTNPEMLPSVEASSRCSSEDLGFQGAIRYIPQTHEPRKPASHDPLGMRHPKVSQSRLTSVLEPPQDLPLPAALHIRHVTARHVTIRRASKMLSVIMSCRTGRCKAEVNSSSITG